MARIPDFSRTPDECRALFQALDSRRDLAELIQVPLQFFTAVLYEWRPASFYHHFSIKKKSGGVRKISAPTSGLYVLQDRLATVLQAVYTPKASAQAYIPGRSVLTNASPHVQRRHVLNLDLEDFFPSLNFGRVRGVMMAKPFLVGEEAATALAQLTCLDGGLPVGAPTSPVISNMICMRLDGELIRLAKTHGAWVTRYADDITFSSDRPAFPEALAIYDRDAEPGVVIGAELEQVISSNGFTINNRKTRLHTLHDRQVVTGVIVNERPNLDRRYVRRIRAMLHVWETEGIQRAQTRFRESDTKDRRKKPASFIDSLQGRIEYLAMIKGEADPVVLRFKAQFENVRAGKSRNFGLSSSPTYPLSGGVRSVFLSHVSEDRARVAALERSLESVGLAPWRDQSRIAPGSEWLTEIREAISKNALAFVVCLSHNSMSRAESVMWEELHMAAQVSIRRIPGKPWIFPILLDDVSIPQFELPDGRQLADLQATRLCDDWNKGVAALVTQLLRLSQGG